MLKHYGLNSSTDIAVTIKTHLCGVTKEKLVPQWARNVSAFFVPVQYFPHLNYKVFSISRGPCTPLPPLLGELIGKGKQHEL